MRFFACILMLLAWTAPACNSPGTAPNRARPAASATSAQASYAAVPVVGPLPYEVRGLIDPGLNDLVAAAFLVPKNWLLRQGLRRTWQGAVPETKLYVALTAPDGRSSIEFLPPVTYYFTDWVSPPPYWNDPVENPPTPQEHYPMAPLAYLRGQLLPLLAKQLKGPIRLTAAQGDSVLPKTALPPEATGYVEGVLPSGRHLRLTTRIQYFQTKKAAATDYQWLASTSLVQSDTALATCVAYSQLALKSLAFNTAWQRQQEQLAQDGQLLNAAELGSDGLGHRPPAAASALRLAAPPSPARAYQRQIFKSNRPEQPEYSGPARPVALADSATGGPVYRLATGKTFPTNAPLDTSRVAWAALQRREAARYQRPLATLPGRRLMLAPLPNPSRYERLFQHYRAAHP